MTIHEARQSLVFRLFDLYDDREAANIADLVMEKLTGWKRIDRIVHRNIPLSRPMSLLLAAYAEKLSRGMPVQYVLEEAWFMGMQLLVNQAVLIPRPETEELAEAVFTELKATRGLKTVLDIGTGSGCIAIAVASRVADAVVHACDISAAALEVARTNIRRHDVSVNLVQCDILDAVSAAALPNVRVIVSNPPYIGRSEAEMMHPNVLQFEPHEALFVDDNDLLIFYAAIARTAQQKLDAGGAVMVEANEKYAGEVAALFRAEGFAPVTIRIDMQGKERIVNARWSV